VTRLDDSTLYILPTRDQAEAFSKKHIRPRRKSRLHRILVWLGLRSESCEAMNLREFGP